VADEQPEAKNPNAKAQEKSDNFFKIYVGGNEYFFLTVTWIPPLPLFCLVPQLSGQGSNILLH